MKKIIYAGIYIIFLIITVIFFENYLKKLVTLKFDNEKIIGEITNIEYVHQYNSSYNKIYYTFDYNGKEYIKTFDKTVGGFFGILNKFVSLLMNYHYNVGQKIQILYNAKLNFSCVRDELSLSIIEVFWAIICIPLIALIIIVALFNELKTDFNKLMKKQKIPFKIFSKKKNSNCKTKAHVNNIFYIQDKDYKIKETIFNEPFDYENVVLNNLIDGTIICYGIQKGDNFVELSYFDNNYIFRIYKNGKEEEIINDKNKNVKGFFEKLVEEI